MFGHALIKTNYFTAKELAQETSSIEAQFHDYDLAHPTKMKRPYKVAQTSVNKVLKMLKNVIKHTKHNKPIHKHRPERNTYPYTSKYIKTAAADFYTDESFESAVPAETVPADDAYGTELAYGAAMDLDMYTLPAIIVTDESGYSWLWRG